MEIKIGTDAKDTEKEDLTRFDFSTKEGQMEITEVLF